MVEMRWIDYDTQSCKAIIIPYPLNINTNPLFFAFSLFEIQRIIIQVCESFYDLIYEIFTQDLAFTDEIVHFLRTNLHSCPSLSPVQLTLNNLDFRLVWLLYF